MNKSDQEPDEHSNVGVDISAFIVALKEIVDTNTPEVVKMLLASIYIKPQSKEDISASEKGETTDEIQGKVDFLKILSDSARSQQEFAVSKPLLAIIATRHDAKGLKRKSKEQIDERVPEDRSKKRRTRNESNESKASSSVSVLEPRPSTSQLNGSSKYYKCYFCDSTLSGLSGIQGHYKRKHEIIDPTEILFYNGEPLCTLPSSNVNTQGGNASWFVNEKINALEKYRAGICRLCEKDLEDPETLSKHYEIYHKVAYLKNVEVLFKFKTGAHLDGLPTSDPRKQRQPRQTPQRHQFKKTGNGSKRRTSARSTGNTPSSSSDEESVNDDTDKIDDNKEQDTDKVEAVAIKRRHCHCVANLSRIIPASLKANNEEKLLDATDDASVQNNNHENSDTEQSQRPLPLPIITSFKTERIDDSEETSVQDNDMVDRNSRDDD